LKITVHAREGALENQNADFALNVAKNSIEFYSAYFANEEPVPPKIGMFLKTRIQT
jgi:aminopeptidase N